MVLIAPSPPPLFSLFLGSRGDDWGEVGWVFFSRPQLVSPPLFWYILVLLYYCPLKHDSRTNIESLIALHI